MFWKVLRVILVITLLGVIALGIKSFFKEKGEGDEAFGDFAFQTYKATFKNGKVDEDQARFAFTERSLEVDGVSISFSGQVSKVIRPMEEKGYTGLNVAGRWLETGEVQGRAAIIYGEYTKSTVQDDEGGSRVGEASRSFRLGDEIVAFSTGSLQEVLAQDEQGKTVWAGVYTEDLEMGEIKVTTVIQYKISASGKNTVHMTWDRVSVVKNKGEETAFGNSGSYDGAPEEVFVVAAPFDAILWLVKDYA